jgi:signal transduction histidine kinase
MRFLYFIFLLSFSIAKNSFSQNTSIPAFHLFELPQYGIVLDSGWKFIADDNPDYAKSGYDDSQWQSMNPTLDVHDVPAIVKKGIGWFRLHLLIDSNLLKKQLALIINQASASEIFLNGQLIYRFGTISTHPKDIIAYDPASKPVSFPLNENMEQVLAVRYALQPDIRYTDIWARTNPIINAKVNEINTAFDQYRFQRGFATSIIFRMGIFLILAILHLAYYLNYPPQKANLYFSLFAFLSIGGLLQLNLPNEVELVYYLSNLTLALAFLQIFLLLTAVYYLFDQKQGWIYWGLLLGIFISIFLNGWGYPSYWAIIPAIIYQLVNLEIIRIAFKALKLKKKGAWIICAGGICFLVFYLSFQLGVAFNYIGISISVNYTLGDLLFNIAALTIPIAISIYLGLDFAFTNYALKQKLIEVEKLSEKTIIQEKEKQQILATQNETLEKQVTERTAELKQSLDNLKSTQGQLIQSEKMASLGELTAGIAHEIQNPLNFVNNFSELNNELIEELKSELAVGNLQSATEIAGDVKDNSEKITQHGKRADAIVKGMLQHSQKSIGEKISTDINTLADEYIRLSYHGLRAKDKNFNATLKTDFDASIGKINIVPQDIGRVLLNLYNNAFYAVNEKSKLHNKDYNPAVSVSTEKINDKVQIKVQDNGNGVPKNIIDKIFQPFFTTKPTGQGTGLGLSLSYDIIKAHGGEITVKAEENDGSVFTVTLPL